MEIRSTEYPTPDRHADDWAQLAREIAALKETVSEHPVRDAAIPAGELLIIGSGIESIGFTLGDEETILAADKVFYCVADPATVVWIKQRRPDAFDLYVLYDDRKVRYTTYMQMAEAQLFYVRQGLKVVVIFYGHPGVFVLSTHRAIQIARREGHRAKMKAAVSALDCLCADLGVDPSQPGLQTHEATDMMIRGRKPDATLHVVLWQVGLIGEMGFRRKGYLNLHFSRFIEYLQQMYGDHYPVTHYVASRYATIEPLIETWKLSELHNPDVQMSITGLSTFYLPPKDTVDADPLLMAEIGLLGPGQTVRKSPGPLRDIGRYTDREKEAFRDFATFRIPAGYQWQPETPASRFLIELREDCVLQQKYLLDPPQAFDDLRFQDLSARDRALLSTRDSGALQVAAKGINQRQSPNHQFLMKVLAEKSTAVTLLRKTKGFPRDHARSAVSQWADALGFPIVWSELAGDIDFLHHSHLFPWNGVYLDQSSPSLLITVITTRGSNSGTVYVGDTKVHGSFQRGTLQWTAEYGNPHNGFLRFKTDKSGSRQIIGKLWNAGEPIPVRYTIAAEELDPGRALHGPVARWPTQLHDLSQLTGEYLLCFSDAKCCSLSVTQESLRLAGQPIESFSFERGTLRWKQGPPAAPTGTLQFLLDPVSGAVEFFGQSSSADRPSAQRFHGVGRLDLPPLAPPVSRSPEWAWQMLESITRDSWPRGGLCLWHRWEKQAFIAPIVNKLLPSLL